MSCAAGPLFAAEGDTSSSLILFATQMIGRALTLFLSVATALRSTTITRAPTRGIIKMASGNDPYSSIATTLALVEEKQLLSKVKTCDRPPLRLS